MTSSSTSSIIQILSDPSISGPNMRMNTQAVVDNAAAVNETPTTMSGGYVSDWIEVQWNNGTTFDPTEGTETSVWDNNYGYSVGHWSQGSATSKSGSSSWSVFEDPTDSHYVYRLAAQGGSYNDVQLKSIGISDYTYSLNHQITITLDQGISGFTGSTGNYEAGVNVTLNFHSDDLNFGMFLQFVSVDSRGSPQAYLKLTSTLNQSIYNVTGSNADYINPTDSSTDGVMYTTTIDVNSGLMEAIKAIVAEYPQYATELEDLSNWYMTGVYIGVETIGSGLTSDYTANYYVKDISVTYDESSSVTYTSDTSTTQIVSMEEEGSSVSSGESLVVQGVGNSVIISNVQDNNAGTLIKSYVSDLQTLYAASDMDNTVLASGTNALTTSKKAGQGIISQTGSYTVSGNYDYFVVAATSDTTLNGAVSLDLTSDTSSYLTVVSSNSGSTHVFVGNQSGSYASTQGDNYFDAQGSSGDWDIVLSSGNNTVYGGNGTNTIEGGSGSNHIYLGNSNNYVRSSGHDTIVGQSGAIDTVTLLGGSSSLTLYTNAVVADLSTGNTISIGDNSTVYGGTSSTITLTSGSATVIGTSGDTISATGYLNVTHGSNQNITVDGTISFISGTGETTVSAGAGTIWGANDLTLHLSSQGSLLFTANQPYTTGDESVDATNVAGGIQAWTGAGSQTIIGGSASDWFYFGTAFTGSDTSTGSYATVTGGAGAANHFGMLANHTSGHFFITDFRVGTDEFFLYNYKPSNEASSVAAILSTATVSGGNTSITVDGDAIITFVGVTSLNASSLSIS